MANNLERLVKYKFNHNFHIKEGATGREYVVDCPHCPPGKGRRKMNINCDKMVAFCHREQKSYDLMSLLNTKVKRSSLVLSTIAGSKPRAVPSPGKCTTLLELDKSSEAIQFLLARMLPNSWTIEELANTFKLRYCYSGSMFLGGVFNTTNTLVIPVIDGGKEVGWQARLLYNPTTADPTKYGFKRERQPDGSSKVIRPPKYCTSPGLKRSGTLWNIDNAKKYKSVVITEGPFDAMAVGPNAVAAFGKGISDLQVRLLKYNWEQAYVLLDADAEKEGKLIASSLARSIKTKFISLKGIAKDPGDLDRVQIGELLYDS